jgi:hypothetical protein
MLGLLPNNSCGVNLADVWGVVLNTKVVLGIVKKLILKNQNLISVHCFAEGTYSVRHTFFPKYFGGGRNFLGHFSCTLRHLVLLTGLIDVYILILVSFLARL